MVTLNRSRLSSGNERVSGTVEGRQIGARGNYDVFADVDPRMSGRLSPCEPR
jgi:hypothetical protein